MNSIKNAYKHMKSTFISVCIDVACITELARLLKYKRI